MLSREEYQAIADSLDFPRSAFIDGKFIPGSGKKMPTTNPATGKKLCDISACNKKDVDLAVSKASVKPSTRDIGQSYTHLNVKR